MNATDFLADSIRSAWDVPFRGEIYEYGAQLNLQAGYAVKGRFDIATLPHLIEPFRAIRDPSVRLVSIQGAVQTCKSLITDITVPYWIEHDPGDILWTFEDDKKARDYANTRFMPLVRSIPSVHKMLEDVPIHSKTQTQIRFNHCNLTMCGLNEGNVQSISYRYIVCDEAWMARANGLLRHAKLRTRHYPDTKKILFLGQGGIEDEDADTEHKETDCRVLHFTCPFCGFVQPFERSRLRGDDHPEIALRGSYAGLTWDENETTKPGGRWNEHEVGKCAHHRCWRCDGRIEDRPVIRQQIAASYSYVSTNPRAPKDHVGFQWPAEACIKNSFAEQAIKYLRAKAAADLGYRLPMQEFIQKERGETWSENFTDDFRAIAQEHYDVKSDWPDEAHRVLIADCQRDLEKFYASIYAVSRAGESRELARQTVGSFDALAALQSDWKVQDQCVFLDCGYEMTRVLRECVRRGHAAHVKIGGKVRQVWRCWTGLKGSGVEVFLHIHPKTKVKEWRIYSERKHYDVNVGTGQRGPRAPWYEWSNLHCKDLLRARRDGDLNVPKFRTLPDELPQTDAWSHFCQMRSEKREETYQGGKKRVIWVPIKPGRPNHEWDKGGMLMAVMAILGIIGAPEPDPAE